jgi:deoxycytidine triphosphate deaminase
MEGHVILSGTAIRKRLESGEILVEGTWDEACIKEASYILRVAPDGMLISGTTYPPGTPFPEPTIRIEPGSIIILSTVERFKMPRDLVGHQGIRFDYAVQGLTGLMGIQVDPLFGSNVDDERLYLRFANLGNDAVVIRPMEAVFNIEFQTVDGDVDRKSLDDAHGPRRPTWDRLLSLIAKQRNPSWSYATRVQIDLKGEVERVEKVFQPVVMFGVFLVAATLLGAVLAVLLSVGSGDVGAVPPWVTDWMWGILLATVSVSALAVALIGAATAFRVIRGK